jgi:ABC-2 type transport system permease protein
VTTPPAAWAYRAERSSLLWATEREVLRFLKLWRFSIAGPVLSAVLFLVVFGSGLGGQVLLDQPNAGRPSVGYALFILPGLLVQAALTVGFINGTTSLFEARKDRYLNDILSSPLRWWEYLLALVAGAVVRGALTTSGILLLAIPISGFSLRRPFIATVAVLAILVIAAQIGVLAGSYARSLDNLYSLESLVVLPLTFLGGIFYTVDRLPQPWLELSRLNPVLYLVQALRIGFLGGSNGSAALALGVTITLAALLTAWSAWIFKTAKHLKP